MKAKTAAMPTDPTGPLLSGFSALDCKTSRVHFAGVIGGEGPPVLLLHGYPQSHVTWHQVGPALAEHFTVIAADLPGYGNSRVLDAGPWHKRAAGDELVAMMRSLGHDRFAVIGHDRGARVGYRLALDSRACQCLLFPRCGADARRLASGGPAVCQRGLPLVSTGPTG